MSPADLRKLRQLARLEGVQLSYLDAAGQVQEASPEALQGILAALGHSLGNTAELGEALRTARERAWRQCVEPVTVAWDNGRTTEVTLRLPESFHASRLEVHLQLEDGQTAPLRLLRQPGSKSPAGDFSKKYIRRRVILPSLPHGYHHLHVETQSGRYSSLIISAPVRSYTEPGGSRRWGVFLPMYAAHSKDSWGAGNLRDWERLARWTAALGGQVVGTLPVLAAFLDRPTCSPSPYSPASRLFWNEFYLDITSIPELESCRPARRLLDSAEFQHQLRQFRRRREIDYARQARARRDVLELLAREFFAKGSVRRSDFERFLHERPDVDQYASFRAACDQAKSGWPSWPDRQRHGRLGPSDYSAQTKRYHLYVQWLAQRQIEQVTDSCREAGISFYLDLPLGVHPDGYDVWREQDVFALKAHAGAPPDLFFSKGQDWGFPPLHPRKTGERGYGYVIEFLRFQMRHTGLLRIDHVMGLHRLYWLPAGLPPDQGTYVSYPADEFYAILCLESQRHRTTLVGENLGTVPPEVNAGMKRHQLRQMFVLQFEQRPDPKQALRSPPAYCVASINTHDMPTFCSHWEGDDLADRVDLGLIKPRDLPKEQRRRRQLHTALIRFLQREGWLHRKRPPTDEVLRACLNWLAASPAEVVLVNLEDLWLEPLPQNVPGTVKQRANWQRKAAYSLEEIERLQPLQQILRELDRFRKQE